MVIKGGARSGAASLAAHLQRVDTNERAELRQLRGVAAKDLDGALLEMEAVSLGSRSKRHFYHASINTRADEVMTDEQWTMAVDRLEKELQLTDQPRAMMFHLKEGRAHVHVVWSRIDLESMTAISDSHNFRRHELVSRELEREFGHARVQGAHIEREGSSRPDRTPSQAELQQAERAGPTPAQAKVQITDIWNRTDSGRAFAAAIAAEGWLLARGDKRDFVLIDPFGELHSLARRLDGATAKDVRKRLADIDAATLPNVDEAKASARTPMHEHATLQLEPTIGHVRRTLRGEAVGAPHLTSYAEPVTAADNAGVVAKQHVDQPSAWHKDLARNALIAPKGKGRAPDDGGIKVVRGATGLVFGLGDFITNLLAGPSPTKTPLVTRLDKERAEKALRRMGDDMQAGRNLRAEDVQNLTHEQKLQILSRGDDAVRQMVEDERRRTEQRARDDDRGRGMER